MSSPIIDLTGSDDELVFSQPRSKTKRRADVEAGATPSKRTRHPPDGFQASSPLAFIQRGISLESPNTPSGSQSSSNSTPQSNDRHRQDSLSAPSPPVEDEDEDQDEVGEFEEITRIEFEQDAHCRVAMEPPVGYRLVGSAYKNGCLLKPGANIELQDGDGVGGGDFLHIAYIFRNKKSEGQDDGDAYILRGILLQRNRKLGNMFPRRLNELVAIISKPTDDGRPDFTAGLQDRSLTEFICLREIRFTNVSYPRFYFREGPEAGAKWHVRDERTGALRFDDDTASREGILVCRYKKVVRWTSQAKSEPPKVVSEECSILDPDETDPLYRRTRPQLIREYLRKVRGADEDEESCGGLTDLFSGSGGASKAARLSGLDIRLAVDNKECAVRSHQHNHPHCVTLLADVFDLIASLTSFIHTDICHSSCPCQFWSPAHTVPGKDDEMNEAAAFMVRPAAIKTGCRIMSFEQTPGFSRINNHRPHWNMFINQFTSMGFSVKWMIVRFDATGCPNSRPRIWLWATCPGQIMPSLVQSTHGPPGSGLRPYMTVREAIANIPAHATLHDPEEQVRRFRSRRGTSALPVAEWDKPLKHLITRSGPKALHPSGTRRFTVRETLCLQGFRMDYHHIGSEDGGEPSRTASMGMAGDAVPPKPAAPYFASAKEALRVTDEEIAAYRDEVIDLSE